MTLSEKADTQSHVYHLRKSLGHPLCRCGHWLHCTIFNKQFNLFQLRFYPWQLFSFLFSMNHYEKVYALSLGYEHVNIVMSRKLGIKITCQCDKITCPLHPTFI